MRSDRIGNWLKGERPPLKRRSREEWDVQYAEGSWDFLASVEEMSRYWIGLGYCSSVPRPSVLDVGCGTGLLEEKLRLLPYSSYLGIDFSIEALKAARRKLPSSCSLVCADMTTFETSARFDVVAFMELEWPLLSVPVMRQYLKLLRPGGRILLSLFDGRNRKATLGAWEEVQSSFRIEDMTRLENVTSEKAWTIAWISEKS
jgi:SAM-dependent methyltransferase